MRTNSSSLRDISSIGVDENGERDRYFDRVFYFDNGEFHRLGGIVRRHGWNGRHAVKGVGWARIDQPWERRIGKNARYRYY